MMPTAWVAMPARARTSAAKGTWNPRPRGMFEPRVSSVSPPEEQSITSTPTPFSARASVTVSSMSQPCPEPSRQESRANSGFSSGQAARTASAVSTAKRMRFSGDPP